MDSFMIDFARQKSDTVLPLLRRIVREFAPVTFSNSLGAEDMVLTDLICTNGLPIDMFTLDSEHGLMKFSPLADWSEQEVWTYIRERQVPYHALHDRGYPSIGCAPCTRATAPGEDVRAGRWWWENAASKECGLHPDPDGRIERAREETV